ncbi:MAG TPA: hypothetical protein PKD55_01485 [Bellilinea sp.]|nr:hypothetical protein [Bellilinea sp.]
MKHIRRLGRGVLILIFGFIAVAMMGPLYFWIHEHPLTVGVAATLILMYLSGWLWEKR